MSLKRKLPSNSESEDSTESTDTVRKMATGGQHEEGEIDDTTESTLSQESATEIEKLYMCKEIGDIAKCFTTLHMQLIADTTEIREKVKAVRRDLIEVQKSVEYVQQEVAAIQEDELPNVKLLIKAEHDERVKLDLWSRKWNVIVKGIDGETLEERTETEGKFRTFLSKELGLDSKANSILLQAIHRLPGGPLGKKNMMVRFLDLGDREMVLEASRKLKRGSQLGVYPDLPPELSQLRYKLSQQLRNMPETMRKRTKIRYLREAPFLKLHQYS